MAFALLVSAAITAAPQVSLMPARASATASVRIVAATRVHLGPGEGQRLVRAAIRVEDGSRRPALLVEFQ